MSIKDDLLRWSEWVLAPTTGSTLTAPPTRAFRSSDPDETQVAMTRAFGPHQQEIVGPSRRRDAVLAEWDVGKLKVTSFRHGGEVICRLDEPGSYYAVVLLVKGSGTVRAGRRQSECSPARAGVLSATQDVVMRWSADSQHVTLGIDRSTLERELVRILHRDLDAPIVFEPEMDLSTVAATRWSATVGFFLAEIGHGTGSIDHPIIRTRVEQLLIDQLLLNQPHNYTRELNTGYRSARHPVVRRATEIVQARAGDPLTIQMLAELVGVSVRSLQQGFHDNLGLTPLEYLREVRLARARDDLLTGDTGDGTSVAEVAYHWGFSHLARFARYYKHRYGELPSETLRRR